MPNRHTFVVNDENAINSYGFRVLTAGIDLKQFKKNPIVLWMHKRPSRWEGNNKDEERFPIGLAFNVRKDPENPARLLADIEFDQNDEFAKTIEKKVESGHVRMCSAGLNPVTLSDDAKYLLHGQTRRSLIKSELVEISIVPFGSNPNSVKLYNENAELIELSGDNANTIVPLLSDDPETNISKINNTKMSDKGTLRIMLAAGLGKPEDISESDLLREVIQLNQCNETSKATIITLNQQITDFEKKETDAKAAIELKAKGEILDEAVRQKIITLKQKPAYEVMTVENIKVALGDIKPVVNLSALPSGEEGTGKGAWDERMEEINANK